jgi:hypothetical protein
MSKCRHQASGKLKNCCKKPARTKPPWSPSYAQRPRCKLRSAQQFLPLRLPAASTCTPVMCVVSLFFCFLFLFLCVIFVSFPRRCAQLLRDWFVVCAACLCARIERQTQFHLIYVLKEQAVNKTHVTLTSQTPPAAKFVSFTDYSVLQISFFLFVVPCDLSSTDASFSDCRS